MGPDPKAARVPETEADSETVSDTDWDVGPALSKALRVPRTPSERAPVHLSLAHSLSLLSLPSRSLSLALALSLSHTHTYTQLPGTPSELAPCEGV